MDSRMQPQALHANLTVADDRGRVAFQPWTVVYCMEQLDQAVAASDTEGFARYVSQPSGSTAAHYQAELLEHPWDRAARGAWEPLPAHSGACEGWPCDDAAADSLLCVVESPTLLPCRCGCRAGRLDPMTAC
jgi:hypothetical protein